MRCYEAHMRKRQGVENVIIFIISLILSVLFVTFSGTCNTKKEVRQECVR